MEGGDLVVVQIRGDESLRGIGVFNLPDVRAGQSQRIQSAEVGRCILTNRGHDQRIVAKELEVVGDVAGAAAELAAHFRHQEGDVEDVDLFRQDVILEPVMEYHDVVVGNRSAD